MELVAQAGVGEEVATQSRGQSGKPCPKVGVIVLNWNGWRDTIECLESLRQLTYKNYAVVVVDNGSADESVPRLLDWLSANGQAVPGPPQDVLASASQYASFEHVYTGTVSSSATGDLFVTLLQSGRNLGYAGGNNVGLAWALAQGCEYALILNNDVKVDEKLLDHLVAIAGETGASVVGALVRDFSGKPLFVRSFYPAMLFYSERQSRVPSSRWWPTDRAEGSAMLLSREFLLERWRTCGYFLDPSLFLYCEEVELALWCRRVARRCVVASDAVVYHKLGASSGGRGRRQQFYYLTRNRVLLARRYLSFAMKSFFLLTYPAWRVLRATMYAVRGRRDIARTIILGLIDGCRGRTGQWHLR